MLRLEHSVCEQRLRAKCLSSLKERWPGGHLPTAPRTLWGDHQEDGPTLSSLVFVGRLRDRGPKIKKPLKIRYIEKNFPLRNSQAVDQMGLQRLCQLHPPRFSGLNGV